MIIITIINYQGSYLMKMKKIFSSTITCLVVGLAFSVSALASPMDDCILDMFNKSGNNMTIGEIKEACGDSTPRLNSTSSASPVGNRLDHDDKNKLEPFTLMAHRPNFFMGTYDSSREEIVDYGGVGYTAELDNIELQFQISIKTPLAIDLFGQKIDIYAAYTNRSFWQAFNDEEQNSAFFRETNHEPEVWMQKRHDIVLPLGFHYKLTSLGFNHQSNGRGGDRNLNPNALSRSWNRIFANFIIENGNFAIGIRPWYRVKEDREDDDNRDITDYLGHGELRLAYKLGEHTFAMMSRNNLESGFSEGAIEASWSFPIGNYPYVKGYIQYFSGYGESLADYDQYNNRIGLGVALSDWL